MKKLLGVFIGFLIMGLHSNATTWNVTVNDGGWGSAATVNTLAWAISQFNAAPTGAHIINIQTNVSETNPGTWNISNATSTLTISGNGYTVDGPGYSSWTVNVAQFTINNWSITAGFSTTPTVLAGSGGHSFNNTSINNIPFTFNTGNIAVSNSKISNGPLIFKSANNSIANSSITYSALTFSSSNNFISNSTVNNSISSFSANNNTISGSNFTVSSAISFNTTSNNLIINSKFNTNTNLTFSNCTNNIIYGNLFNTNNAGTSLVASGVSYDISFNSSTGNIIGAGTAATRNVFALSSDNAIVLTNSSDNSTILGNYFGTDINGTTKLAGTGTNSTIYINTSKNIIIGNNVISSQQSSGKGAIEVAAGNSNNLNIYNNYIGLNKNGLGTAGGFENVGSGILVSGGAINNSTISGNLIATNGTDGITLSTSSAESNLLIINNTIGTDITGIATGLGNLGSGINITTGTLATSTISGNVIVSSGNYGIFISSVTTGLVISSNIVGLNSTGIYNSAKDVGNGYTGIAITGAVTGIQILSNTVSRNGYGSAASCGYQLWSCGIIFDAGAINSATISSNIIGVDNAYNNAGNVFAGLYFFENGNMGGSNISNVLVSGNVIGNNGNCSSQLSDGFASYQANYFTFTNNYVGVSPTGANIGNYANGVEVNTASNFYMSGNQIGYNKGLRPADAACGGIALYKATYGKIVSNNIFSQANNGATPNNGIFVQSGSNIQIGGTGALSNNIYSNGTHGIVVFNGADFIDMYSNSIYCNTAMGINISCPATRYSGDASPFGGNSGYGCTTLTLNSITGVAPTIVSGGNPVGASVYVYGTNLCTTSTCGVNPQGQTLFIGSTTSYPTSTTWSYNNITTMAGVITALAVGSGSDCSGAYCRTSQYSNCVNNTVTPLPIVLSYFNAKALGNKTVLVDWETFSEVNNDYFILEKSTDGSNFEYIGKINGNRTTSNVSDYQFVDKNPNLGVSYYRLKQFDLDGNYKYSDLKTVKIGSDNIVSIYPNPNNGQFTVYALNAGNYEINILDLSGRVVYTSSTSSLETSLEANLQPGLVSGTYLVQVSSSTGTSIQKIVID